VEIQGVGKCMIFSAGEAFNSLVMLSLKFKLTFSRFLSAILCLEKFELVLIFELALSWRAGRIGTRLFFCFKLLKRIRNAPIAVRIKIIFA